MVYALLYALVINGSAYVMVEPIESLEVCRKIAKVMRDNRNEQYPDARCVAILFDKDE
jgi:hypothetical protein